MFREIKNGIVEFFQSLGAWVRLAIIVIVFIAMLTVSGIWMKSVFGVWSKDVDRRVFKATTTYNEGAATFLADSYMEWLSADGEEERGMIKEYVRMRYPNLDVSKIENVELREFYSECFNIY